jgi:hypothetical protein
MNAVLTIIADADGERGIIVIIREAVQIHYILLYLLILRKPFDGGLVQPLAKRLPGVRYVHPSKPWWGCLCVCV